MGHQWGFLFDVWHEEGCQGVHGGLSEQDGAAERRDFRATRQVRSAAVAWALSSELQVLSEHWTMRSLTLCYWYLEQAYVNALLFFKLFFCLIYIFLFVFVFEIQ